MSSAKHSENEFDMPLGISMAIAQNPGIFGLFSSLSPRQREDLIAETRHPGERHDSEITGDMITGKGRAESIINRLD